MTAFEIVVMISLAIIAACIIVISACIELCAIRYLRKSK